MKKIIQGVGIVIGCFVVLTGYAQKNDYAVLVSESVRHDAAWYAVAQQLATRHHGVILTYAHHPEQIIDQLRSTAPRYVAIVDQPQNLDRDFVIAAHRLSRIIDADPFADYIWGIITGYTAEDAQRMVDRSARRFEIKTALNTTCELSSGEWFERFAFLNDGATPGVWGEKREATATVEQFDCGKWNLLEKWVEKYRELDPDLLITSSHATEHNLEMPFSTGNLKPRDGTLYADFIVPQTLSGTVHPRVYFAAGNCLIGNIDRSSQSMAVAWLSGMNATAMVGYVVPTWFGRNGWGALKLWATDGNRLTLAQALYLNQQEMLVREARKSPRILSINYNHNDDSFRADARFEKEFAAASGDAPTKEDRGYAYDRDVVVLYGDPAWDVHLNSNVANGYRVVYKRSGKKLSAIITTTDQYNAQFGANIKTEHVDRIPLALYFPHRLNNARLVNGESVSAVVADDFALLYDCNFEKNKTYTFTFLTE